jgi:hypothetical protein
MYNCWPIINASGIHIQLAVKGGAKAVREKTTEELSKPPFE